MGRKTTIIIFQATNNQNLTPEDLDMGMKGKSLMKIDKTQQIANVGYVMIKTKRSIT